MLGDRKSSTLLYISWIWAGVTFLLLFTGVTGGYAASYVSGVFAGMAWMYAASKGGKMKTINNKVNPIQP